MAFKADDTIYRLTELTTGKGGSRSKDFSHLLHLMRARVQVAVANAVGICMFGRNGKKAQKAMDQECELQEAFESGMPLGCLLADSVREEM